MDYRQRLGAGSPPTVPSLRRGPEAVATQICPELDTTELSSCGPEGAARIGPRGRPEGSEKRSRWG